MRVYAMATLGGQLLYLIGVFALVRDAGDGWRVLAIQAAGVGLATVFPQAIGLAATWDEELVRRVGDVTSRPGACCWR